MQRDLVFTNGKSIPAGTFYCVGRNYAAHAREMNSAPPESPMIFIKPTSAYIPAGESIIIPSISEEVHHEIEMVAVISQECYMVSPDEAASYIGGYAVGIDVTLRDVQAKAKAEGAPWAISKGFYTSAPVSEFIPAEGLPGNPVFDLELRVNGTCRQKGTTADMLFSTSEIISYLSGIFYLNPGDCIFTGTPEGVGRILPGDKLTAFMNGVLMLKTDVRL